ncbi:MAG: hypothetical protein ABIO70_28840 [Pseudomonadota bacterium]
MAQPCNGKSEHAVSNDPLAIIFDYPVTDPTDLVEAMSRLDGRRWGPRLVERLATGRYDDAIDSAVCMAVSGALLTLGTRRLERRLLAIVLDRERPPLVRAAACLALMDGDCPDLDDADGLATFVEMTLAAFGVARRIESCAALVHALIRTAVGAGSVPATLARIERWRLPTAMEGHRVYRPALEDPICAPAHAAIVEVLEHSRACGAMLSALPAAEDLLRRFEARASMPPAYPSTGRAWMSTPDGQGRVRLIVALDNPDGSVTLAESVVPWMGQEWCQDTFALTHRAGVQTWVDRLLNARHHPIEIHLLDAAAISAHYQREAEPDAGADDGVDLIGLLGPSAGALPEIEAGALPTARETFRLLEQVGCEPDIVFALEDLGPDRAALRSFVAAVTALATPRNVARLNRIAGQLALWCHHTGDEGTARRFAALRVASVSELRESPLAWAMWFMTPMARRLALVDPRLRERVLARLLADGEEPLGVHLAVVDFGERAYRVLEAILEERPSATLAPEALLELAVQTARHLVPRAAEYGFDWGDDEENGFAWLDPLHAQIERTLVSEAGFERWDAQVCALDLINKTWLPMQRVCEGCEIDCLSRPEYRFPRHVLTTGEHPSLKAVNRNA